MQMNEHKNAGVDAAPRTEEAEIPTKPETEAARGVIKRIRSGVAAAREPLADRVSQAATEVGHAWNERPGARVRRVRRMGKRPLPYLYDVHPDARLARPVEVGLRTLDIDEIAGTAVGGGAQRGGDFLPLKSSRTKNWQARWQRLRKAQDRLAVLPPIDVFKFGGRYWVVDGHNRVALALYGGQVAIDANVDRARSTRRTPDRTDQFARAVGRGVACRPGGRQRPSAEPRTVARGRDEHRASRRRRRTDDPKA